MYFELSGLENVVFGIGHSGQMSASLNIAANPPDITLNLASVAASDSFVRGHSFERRYPDGGGATIYRAAVAHLCNAHNNTAITSATHTELTVSPSKQDPASNQVTFSADPDIATDGALEPNEIYLTLLYACAKPDANTSLSLSGTVNYTNPTSPYPHLGFEEMLFPVLSQIILYILSACCLVIILSWIYARVRRLPPSRALHALFAACFSKGLMAGLTFLYFSSVGQDGMRSSWYVYVRVSLAAVADIAFVTVVVSLSSGYRIFPAEWFVDGRSPVLLVYIGVTLQILIVISVKIMFAFRIVSVVTYTLAAGAIAALVITSSLRNFRFLSRYGEMIERSHIILKTTPVRRMRLFFIVNVGIVIIAYAFKIVAVGIWDHGLRRPDLMWASLEMADTALLLWYLFAALPRKKSALYLDLTNLSNARLQQAEAWRASQRAIQRREANSVASEGASAGPLPVQAEGHQPESQTRGTPQQSNDEIGAAQETRIDIEPAAQSDPQPPWIPWSPDVSLPRPDANTWGNYTPVTRILRRERRFVPVLPPSIILGSPLDSPDTVELTIGVPTTGPDSLPRSYDEKGNEIPANRESLSRGTGSGSTRPAVSFSGSRLAQDNARVESGSFAPLSRVHRAFVRRRSMTDGANDLEDGSSVIDLSVSASSSMLRTALADNRLSISCGESCDGEIRAEDGEIRSEDGEIQPDDNR